MRPKWVNVAFASWLPVQVPFSALILSNKCYNSHRNAHTQPTKTGAGFEKQYRTSPLKKKMPEPYRSGANELSGRFYRPARARSNNFTSWYFCGFSAGLNPLSFSYQSQSHFKGFPHFRAVVVKALLKTCRGIHASEW